MWRPKPRITIFLFLLLLSARAPLAAEPTQAALSAYNAYVSVVESRLARQHSSSAAFLAGSPQPGLRAGEVLIEQLTPETGPPYPGAMLHHWRGTAFAPGATAASFERLLRDLDAYPQVFSPEVTQAEIVKQSGDRLEIRMRVRQRHVISVVMQTSYDVSFGRLDPQHGYSVSRSTRISEIDAPDTAAEHPMEPRADHGFLWRQNTYWSYEERDGGLYVQVESVSLTRSIPRGLGWAVRPYALSIPRDSLTFTLSAACKALRASTFR